VTAWTLAGATFPARVWTASGCGGTGRELAAYLDLARIGAFVTRTITLDPSDGTPGRRVVEVPGGLLNAIGTQNPGLDAFLATELPPLAQQQVPVVVSITADEVGEYAELARRVGASPGVRGVEVNLSLPAYADDSRLGNRMGNTFQVGKLIGTVRAEVPRGVPVLAKLGPREDAVALARACAEGGADAVVLVNAVPALALDPTTGQALAGSAGLSGPALRPLALRAVSHVHAELPALPLVGVGGIVSGRDARAFLDAGASAVQVGTACLADPTAPVRVLDELDELDGPVGGDRPEGTPT